MSAGNFLSPPANPGLQQHAVADPANAARLMAAIPDQPERLAVLRGKHIASINHFGAELLQQIFRRAAGYESGAMAAQVCTANKVVGGIFLDSNRHDVPLPFVRACLGLGGHFIDLSHPTEDILRSKRDFSEVAALANNYSDMAVMSAPHAEAFMETLRYAQVPLINAGNGDDEAPIQALTDLYTLFKWRPSLLQQDPPVQDRLRIGIFGMPGNTATLRSLLTGLSLFPQAVGRIILFDRSGTPCSEGQREALEQAGIQMQSMNQLHPNETVMGGLAKEVPELDVIYSHLKQQHAVSRMDMLEFKKLFAPQLLLLSPQRQLPDFSAIINNSPHNGFFTQAKSAVYVLMALLGAVMA